MRCLIVDDVHESLFPFLEQAGIVADYQHELDIERIKAFLPEVEGLVVRSKLKLDRALLTSCSKLKFIGRAGAGLDGLDVQACKDLGITVFHAAEGNADAVAEHSLGFIFSLLNKLGQGKADVSQGHWDREGNRGYELADVCIGIIGAGHMGLALHKKLKALGANVLVYDVKGTTCEPCGAQFVSLETLHAEADLISLHIPLTETNRHLVCRSYLSHFTKLKWVVQTSRGEVVKIEDVLSLLKEGKLMGAALDVFPNEKPETWSTEERAIMEQLAQFPNVLMSPHVAGWSYRSYREISRVLGQKILAYSQSL
jgi:D-3-phosphoglycerate dehydrogenase